MGGLGALGFATPGLLLALVLVPALWWILRAVPPAPVTRRFPGVALLLGLEDRAAQAARTPPWLLILRMAALAAAIIGFAGPVLNPQGADAARTDRPLLILADASWAEATDWPRRQDRLARALAEADRAGRPAALVSLTDLPPAITFDTAATLAATLPGLKPQPWEPDTAALADRLPEGTFDTLWLSDGLARPGRADLAKVLSARGTLTVSESPRPLWALGPATLTPEGVSLPVLRARATGPAEAVVLAQGLDPAGLPRELARGTVRLGAAEDRATLALPLPPEVRNRLTRLEISGEASAGAVSLTDDTTRRRKVAILAASDAREGLELVSAMHYLTRALAPSADLIQGTLADVILADPDVIILADMARIPESAALTDWVEKGGLLVRFAGPRLAASDEGRAGGDPLLPVRLRQGGRSIGGAMSWGAPRGLAPFPKGSPFEGLAIPAEVTVTAQVIAEPDPDLADKTLAALEDGTPLVTRAALGQGQVVLVHVTANAEWSNLPLSGLFVQMLERLAISAPAARAEPGAIAGSVWTAERVLDGFGSATEADLAGVPGARLAEALAGRIDATVPPGLYAAGDRRVALNVIAADRRLSPADWPATAVIEGAAPAAETPLMAAFLTGALALLLADILATLALTRRLRGAAVVLAALALMLPAPDARAEDDARLIAAAADVVLAYVITGDAAIDSMSEAGLRGLSRVLYDRTTVEPVAPMGIDLNRDDLSLFTFLYWPITPDQPLPSAEAYGRLNRFLRAGGMILFDTRDADLGDVGTATPNGRALQRLAAPLDIPPLAPVPEDHVLTRAFYLIQDFPGRHTGTIWVEAPPPDADTADPGAAPFRQLNDGVTPVVIGGNDWAAAWAIDSRGLPLVQVGHGYGGERQREIAYRFGVNLIMHVLTGNYKSDQVHVPALLERLGQ